MREPVSLPALDAPADQSHELRVSLRYEDLAQDGRIKADAVPFAMGEACWRGLLVHHPLTERLRATGVVPILRRLVVAADETPLSTMAEPRVRGSFGLAHVLGPDGAPERFLLELAAELEGPRGRTFARVEREGEVERVARVYGEHVFTRLFAPPGKRRVTELPDGLEPGPARPWVEVGDLLMDPRLVADGAPAVERCHFGLVHTDSNQHVNSLVYPRLFEESAVRAFGDAALVRAFDVVFRKPCFAGDAAEVRLQRVTRDDDARGVLASLHVDGEPTPRCAAQLWLG